MRKLRRPLGPKKPLGAIPLLEASFRLFRWKREEEAASALDVSPDQVRLWRRGAEPMSVVDYVSLTAMVNIGIAQARQPAKASDLDVQGAAESLGLRVADA